MADVEEASQVATKEAAPANVVEEPLDLVRLSLDERIYVKVRPRDGEVCALKSYDMPNFCLRQNFQFCRGFFEGGCRMYVCRMNVCPPFYSFSRWDNFLTL